MADLQTVKDFHYGLSIETERLVQPPRWDFMRFERWEFVRPAKLFYYLKYGDNWLNPYALAVRRWKSARPGKYLNAAHYRALREG